MKRFTLVIISVILVISSLIPPLAFTDEVKADTGNFGLGELTNGADTVIVGTVVERTSYWNDEHTGIFTSVVLSVEEKLKGAIDQDRITVTFTGGEVDEIGQWVSDMPNFDQGEKAVVFLKELPTEQIPNTKALNEQYPEEQFEVYDGFRGKFTIKADKVGNLPVADFINRVNSILQGKVLLVEELDVPLSLVISPYSYTGMRWFGSNPVVNYLINENCGDCTGEGAAVRNAAATWSAAGAYFSFNYAGTTTATAVTQNFVNEILWTNLGSGSTLALTTTWYYPDTGQIIECDMEFNDYHTWSTSSQYDVQTVALHEFGHYLHLDHSSDTNAVMYYLYQGIRRTLHADDIAGIRFIYGAIPVAPTVTNSSGANNIESASARLNGQVTSTGGENPTVYIYWGPSDGGTSPGSWAYDVNLGAKAAGTFYTDISSLTAGTPYYYRCYAVNSGGGSWASSTTSFTTSAIAPTVTNYNGASNIAPTSARMNGQVTSTGGENPTVHIYWGQSDGGTSPGSWAHDVNLGVKAAGTFYTDISSLTASTPYYYRCYAANSRGGSWAASSTSFTTPAILVSIAITPDNSTVAKGRTKQFTATGTYSDSSTSNITSTATWTSSNTTVATINENTGLAQSLVEGQATITATMGATSDSTILTVGPKVLDVIEITPDNPTIALGRSQQFTATGTYSDTSTANLTTAVTWSSSNTTVATIGVNTGLAPSLAEGQSTITAASGSISDTTILTIDPKVLDSLSVTPPNPSIAAGRTQQFNATGTYSDASTANLTSSVTWSSSNTTVVMINAAGLTTSYASGTANITAASGSVSGNTTLTVTAAVLDSVAVTPVDPAITFVSGAGNQPILQFTATAGYSDGATTIVTSTANWASDNTGVATVGANTGLATTVAADTTTMTATYSGTTGNTTLTVLPDTVAPVVTLTSPTEGLILGNTTLTVSGTVDDVSATANVTVNGGTPTSLSLGTSGNFTKSVTLNTGSNIVLVTAIDGSGNTGTSGTITVAVDPAKPTVTITQPIAGIVTDNSSLAITGTVSGNVTSATLILNGASQSINVTGGSFSANVTLVEGINILVVNAYIAGQEGDSDYLGTSGVRMITLDTTAPVVVIDSPISGGVVSTPGCEVSGTIDDPGVSTANLTLNGASQSIPVVGGSFSQSITLVSGNNTITVAATDGAGNTSSAGSLTAIFDNTKPEVTITAPVNKWLTNTANQAVTGTINDTTITTATLYVNGTPQTISVTSGSFSENVTLAAGANTLEVRASDNATPANTGTSGDISVTLDNTAPTVAIGLSDPTDSITITVISNEALAATPTTSVNSTATVTMTQIDVNKWCGTYGSVGSPIAAGSYSVTANATDRAGNTTIKTVTFSKQTVTISENATATVSTDTTTLEIQTTANVTDASISVTQHLDNPSGNVGNPTGAEKAAGAFVEIVVSPELRDNLEQIYITVDYDPNELPANTDESTLKLYLWDVASGTWQVVPSSGVNTALHYIYGTVTHLSKYGGFGTAIVPPPPPSPPAGGGGGGGGGGGVVGEKRITNLRGVTNNYFQILEDVEALSIYGKAKIFVEKGTKVMSKRGSILSSIVIEKLVEAPDADANMEIIGSAYDIGPNGAQFDPPVLLTIEYNEDTIPEGFSGNSLYIAAWNEENQEWERTECIVDTEADSINTLLDHFSIYTIMVNTRPADFELSELTITPVEASIGEDVTVSVLVTNIGDLTGNYEVSLTIDNAVVQTKEVTVEGGSSETISFSVTPDTVGEHIVNISDLLGKFEVKVPETLPAPAMVPAPASFTISDLSVTPSEVDLAEQVTISAVLTNTGGSEGSYTVVLKIDGAEEAIKEVTLGAGQSETVIFTIAKNIERSYAVDIDGNVGQFIVIVPQPPTPAPVEALPVEPPTNWGLIGGIIAGCVVVAAGLLVYFFMWRKRGTLRPS